MSRPHANSTRLRVLLGWGLVLASLSCGDPGGPEEPTTLVVATSEGIQSSPNAGAAEHAKGAEVPYTFELEPGYENLQVFLDTAPVSPSGSVAMDTDHVLTGLADRKLFLAPGDEALVSSLRALLEAPPMVGYRALQSHVNHLFEVATAEEALRRVAIAQAVAYDGVRDAPALRRAMAEIGESLSVEPGLSSARILQPSDPHHISQALSPLVNFIYVNGIHTQPPQFETTLGILHTVLSEAGYSDRGVYPLVPSYNRSSAEHDASALETWTCLELKAQEAYLGRFSATRAVLSCLFAPGAVNSLLESVGDIVNILLGSPPELASVDVLRLKGLMRARLLSGERVVVLAHSQGNLLLSQALDILAEDRASIDLSCIGAVSIAPPVEVTAQPGQQDVSGMIIQGTHSRDILLQMPLGNLLVPKVRNSLSTELDTREARLLLSPVGLLGVRILDGYALHSIDNSYLEQPETRERIQQALRQQVQTVIRDCPPTTPPPSLTSTAITADDPDPSEAGSPVTVAVTVTANAAIPTGSVSITDGVAHCDAALGNGSGSCSLTLMTPGQRTLTATYSGNEGFAGSSDTEAHTVLSEPGDPSASTSTVTASPPTITAGGGTSTVTVTVQSASGDLLTGVLVSLSATGSGNTIDPPNATSDASGVATFAFSSTVAETKTITATAGGVRLDQQPVITVQDVAGGVTTEDPSAIANRKASLNGTVNPNGIETFAYFEWGREPSFANAERTRERSQGAGSITQPFTELLVGLSAATTYYYRAAARRIAEIEYGEVRSFTTSGSAAKRIAFVSERDGNREIYVMNEDGTNQRRLTVNTVADGTPAWSPTDDRIAFDSDRDGNSEIYVVNASGTGVASNLTNNAGSDHSPTWSPDGTRIAFVSNRNGHVELFVLTVDGSVQPQPIPNTVLGRQPSWCGDGRIVFTSGGSGLAIVTEDGTRQDLDHIHPAAADPACSADAARVAFTVDGFIHTAPIDGGVAEQLTFAEFDVEPTWSPDGTMVAYNRSLDIVIVDTETTAIRGLTGDFGSSEPAWEW